SPQSKKLVPFIPEGGSWKDIPYEHLPERLKKIRDNMKKNIVLLISIEGLLEMRLMEQSQLLVPLKIVGFYILWRIEDILSGRLLEFNHFPIITFLSEIQYQLNIQL